MNEKTKADLDAFRHERTQHWEAKSGTIEPKADFFDQDDHLPKDCPMCNHENGAIGALGKTLQFCCRMCGWWYN